MNNRDYPRRVGDNHAILEMKLFRVGGELERGKNCVLGLRGDLVSRQLVHVVVAPRRPILRVVDDATTYFSVMDEHRE